MADMSTLGFGAVQASQANIHQVAALATAVSAGLQTAVQQAVTTYQIAQATCSNLTMGS